VITMLHFSLPSFAGGVLVGLVAVVVAGALFLRYVDGLSAGQLYDENHPERRRE
jgi:hypothetical protein